jgi:uncharacterized protein YndB with AHSA1/START domain
MRRDVRLERTYPHPPELVWRALTEPNLIGEWLMENDFSPVVGHRFTLRTDPQPGFDGIVHCEVLELDVPRRMRWSWRGGPIDTVVVFDLAPVVLADAAATRLVVQQRGFEGLPAVLVSFILGAGNNEVYGRRLPALLDRLAGRRVEPTPPHRRMTAPWRLLTAAFGPLLRRSERRTRR